MTTTTQAGAGTAEEGPRPLTFLINPNFGLPADEKPYHGLNGVPASL